MEHLVTSWHLGNVWASKVRMVLEKLKGLAMIIPWNGSHRCCGVFKKCVSDARSQMFTEIRWAFEQQRWAHLVLDEAHCNGITVEGTTMIRLILTSHHISKCFLKTGCSKKKPIIIIFNIISVLFNFHIIRFQSLGKALLFYLFICFI